jgi:hypothetical protein
VARKKLPVKKKKQKAPSWAAIGFDVSMSSIAGAGIAWDGTLSKLTGPVCLIHRWYTDTDYFKRLMEAAKAHLFVQDIMTKLLLPLELEQIHIGVEEPVPFGMFKKSDSGWVKQQCQISGAFLGGLIRYGYPSVAEINVQVWRGGVRADLGRALRRGLDGKMDIKEWAMDVYEGIPDWPDLIKHHTKGKIPRPEGSRAQAVQPDDRYDAIGVMDYIKGEIEEGNIELVSPLKRGAVGGGELR